jgi:small subunit ribosomal protein S9
VAEEKEVAEETQPAKEEPQAASGSTVRKIEEEKAPARAPAAKSVEAADSPPAEKAETAPAGEVRTAEATPIAEEPAPPLDAEAEEPFPPMAELRGQTDIYYYGTGRRKTASAQVRLYPSKEPAIYVNDLGVDEYFPRPADIRLLKTPLQVTATEDMFRITVKVRGGGISGQAGAIRHGIARALTKANPELRRTLRREGSLTRDPRMKERKKPGLKRARKAPQYTKR